MENSYALGIWSLLPLVITIIIAYSTKSAVFALITGCFSGVILMGFEPTYGFSNLARDALGNGDFIWICLIIMSIGILFEFYKEAGVIQEFTRRISGRFTSRRGLGFSAWLMGMVIIDDYFSPLMSGMVMRPLTDKARISREKLAFILDSTTAATCVIFPFSAWGAYIAGLTAGQGDPVDTTGTAFTIFLKSIPYNFYSILLLLFTLGIALKLIPDFGPMRKAEKRARETGKVIREGGVPLITEESDSKSVVENRSVNLLTDLAMPMAIIIGIAAGTMIFMGHVLIAEAFIAAVIYMSALMMLRRRITGVGNLMELFFRGIKSVMPAVVIIALAYCLNSVTTGLGTPAFITGISENRLTPSLLVAITFMLTSIISFSTGSSWGAYAIMIPFALPVAFSFTGGVIDPLIYKWIAAGAGGGIIGDPTSPVSDTSILSSAGAGSDHMDHVTTQLPYALLIGAITFLLYLFI